jgi:hypothetical protein
VDEREPLASGTTTTARRRAWTLPREEAAVVAVCLVH